MYAQVVVLTYQPPSVDSYTYEIPKVLQSRIQIGQLVEVPFGKRNPMGIVLSCHPEQSEGSRTRDSSSTAQNDKKVIIKPITKILLDQPILLPYQIELSRWMSSYYIAPMVNCVEAALPPLNAKSLKSNAATNESVSRLSLVFSQSLVLVPSINKLPETLAKFPKAKNYVVYHNELKTSEKFSTWMKILSGEVDYIFGSRSTIFAPCPNLKEIIIYDEHDGAYKDERSPYFDTLTVAQKIAQLTKSQLKIVDPSPKITTYSALQNHIKIQKFSQDIVITNMQNERLSGRHSPISFDLEEEIKNILEEKGNILLFLNKKKESGHLFCKSCKSSLHLETQPLECPNCQSPDIFWNTLHVASLAKEASKLFPKTAVRIVTPYEPFTMNHKPSIDIGTALALYSQQVKKYDLIAHIQTDSLLNLADYTSGEKLFAQVIQLKKLLKDNGKLILQTYNPEHPTILSIEKGVYQSFYQSELNQRRLLSYPPYSLIIKLTVKGKVEDKVKKEAEILAKELGTRHQAPGTILGPYKPTFWQRQPTYHIILRYKIGDYSIRSREKAIMDVSKYLAVSNKNYTIEVEPSGIQ